MAVSDWSATASNNASIDGQNIAEGCPAGNMNGAIRSIMAAVRALFDTLPDFSTLMPKAGGAFSGAVTRAGKGAFLSHNDSSNSSGTIYVQASGGTAPSMSNGDFLIEY